MKVLLAIDGGEASVAARRLLSRVARRDDLEIVVLGVASFDMALHEASYSGHYDAADARARATAVAEAAREELAEDGIDATAEVREGDPPTSIVEATAELGADLVVLGSGRHGRTDALTLGSTSLAVLHGARCAVLIVHDRHDVNRPVRVLVAADGSDGADRAAAAFAALADPARVETTVAAVAKPVGLPGVGAGDEAALEAGEADAAAAAGVLARAGFAAEAVAVRGRPSSELSALAHERDTDLVVVGSRGRGAFAATVLGSVSEHLVRHARAVLVGR